MPSAKTVPEAGAQLVEGTPQLSLSVGAPTVTVADVAGETTLEVTLAGQVMLGDCASLTVTLKEQFVVPAAFVAVQSTVVVPTGNVFGVVITVELVMHVTVGVG